VQRGVLTNDGHTAIRDVLADNNPDLPTDYAYGSDGTAVSESDSSLFKKLISVDLDSILSQNADSDSEWENIIDINATNAQFISNGKLQLGQAGYVFDAVNDISTINRDGTPQTNQPIYNDQKALAFDNTSSFIKFDFTTDYKIPSGDWQVFVMLNRLTDNGVNDILEISVDNTAIDANITSAGAANNIVVERSTGNFDLSKGTHTMRIFMNTENDDDMAVDIGGVIDNRFTFTFDDADLSGKTRNHRNGPEKYPSSVVSLSTVNLEQQIDNGTFNSTWNDISNNQYIALSPDGTNFTQFNNTANGSFSFTSFTRTIDINFQLSGFGGPQAEYPRFDYNGQTVDLWELFIDPDTPSPDDIGGTISRGVVRPNSGLNGDTVREGGLKSGNVLLTRHELAGFTVEPNQAVISSEETTFKGDN